MRRWPPSPYGLTVKRRLAGPQTVHQEVQQPVSLGALSGLAGDAEDAEQAGGGVLGADVGAEVAGRVAGVEDRRRVSPKCRIRHPCDIGRAQPPPPARRGGGWPARCDALVDERLCAEDDGEREPFGVLGAGLGGVDHDPQVVAGDDKNVAVECDESDAGVVDDLVPGLVPERAGLARLSSRSAG